MKQRLLYSELAYVFGVLLMAFGASCMQRADFGMSMVITPAYLLHAKLVQVLPFFSFGFGAATFQGILIAVMCLVLRRFRASYLFSFVTAVIYGVVLDCDVWILSHVPSTLAVRIALYVGGMVITSAGVAFFFRTYIAPEAYELFVKNVSEKYGVAVHKFKTGYDIASLILSVIMSFCFFGFGVFVGVNWGTLICAFINGTLIGWFIKLYDHLWYFEDGIPALRRVMP